MSVCSIGKLFPYVIICIQISHNIKYDKDMAFDIAVELQTITFVRK